MRALLGNDLSAFTREIRVLAGAARRGMTLVAARQAVLLSLMFVGVYGGCNWIAAHRTDVHVWYFDWERQIPFWPPMIVPYLSIDLFFIAAPFLCRDEIELRVFTRRIALAIGIAGVCFLAVPLKFAFDRPPVDGWLGTLMQTFVSLDRPFNLFPSLHLALAAILFDTYRRRTTGIVRTIFAIWFVLIGLSTLFTYQHHVVDVAGGLVLAALSFSLIRAGAARQSHGRHVRVAAYYLLGAAAVVVLAIATWPWGALLVCPAISLTIVGSAYLGLGPAIFGKSNGRIRTTTRVILWPCLLGQWASLAYYRRRCRPFDRVAPGVWIGRHLSSGEAIKAIEAGVTAVLDLSAEMSEAPPFRRLPYHNGQVLDLTAPEPDQLDEGVRFIMTHAGRGSVYVHCKVGYSRSAAVVGAYLLASGKARTSDEALSTIRSARPSIVIRPEAVEAVRRFEARLNLREEQSAPAGSALVAALLAGLARVICGMQVRWAGVSPTRGQRIYFANHTSHLDFVAIWGSLPAEIRVRTRAVAKRDYWDRNPIRRCIVRHLFRAVLVDGHEPSTERGSYAAVAAARRNVERMVAAIGTDQSLILFPEGTRGDGSQVAPFKSGLYHLARLRPDVELVPVLLENMHRILPKGEVIPVPLTAFVTFGRPLRLEPGEDKQAFLARARQALVTINDPCTSPSTLISCAS
jgi:protein-tyrosine phosphatase/1-acyl-sn-glycerol-3-phosphate acyltransferase/membrane-associated phospholipid phosphatase